MAGRIKGDAQPGRTWNRKFNHPYTARKTPPRLAVPILGCNTGGYFAPWALFNASVGPVYGLRGYNTTSEGVPAAWPGSNVGTIPATVPAAGQIVSIRPDIGQVLSGSLDGALAAYFAQVPSGAFVTAWHESEIGAQKAGYSQAQVIAMHTRMYTIFSANAPAAASYGQVASSYSANYTGALGYPLGPWICTPAQGGALLDFYGIDCYPAFATDTFAGVAATTMTAMTGAGVPAAGPWTFPEAAFTATATPVWDGTPSQWLSDGWNVAQAIGALHFLVFISNDLGRTSLYWPPNDPHTLRVVQDIAAISRGDPRPAAAQVPARSTVTPMVTSTSASTLTATFGSNPAAGSKVLVAVQALGTGTLAVTDNGTTPATFDQDASCLNASSEPSVFVYRADNITLPGSGTYAVTVTLSPTGPLQVAACAYTGVENGPPTASSALISAAGNLPALNPVIPADISSLFFEAFFANSSLNPASITSASPEFTVGVTQANGTSSYTGAVSDAIVTSPAARAGGWTLADSPAWSAVMAAYSAFPATVTQVPGAQAAWASSPDPGVGISANAGLASATGTAQAAPVSMLPAAGLAAATGTAQAAAASVLPSAGLPHATGAAQVPALGWTPGLASASGWAAVNAPAVSDSPAPATAAATGAAQAPVATVLPNAGLPAGTGAALFSGAGAAVSVTLTAINPVAATGTALTATVTVAVTAGLASATGAALAPVAAVLPSAGTAAATGTAQQAAAQVSATPGTAAATGAAIGPALGWTPATAAATGAAQAPAAQVSVTAGLPASTGAALQPAVITGVAPAAGLASATGTAQAPSASVLPAPATAAATGAVHTAGLGFTPGLASASAAAVQPAAAVAPAAVTAAGTGAALVASGTHVISAATASGGAQLPALAVAAQASAAQALAAALAPAVTAVAPFTVAVLSGGAGQPLTVLTAGTSMSVPGTYAGTYGPGYPGGIAGTVLTAADVPLTVLTGTTTP